MTHGTQHQMSGDMQQCIQQCSDCHRVCLETLAYCTQQGGRHVEAKHLGLLLDCVQMCHTSADFMIRGSALHTRVCAVCAEVCEQCAQSCDQFGDDAQMKTCADTCRRCAQSCRTMAM
jgi:hypothetical protein